MRNLGELLLSRRIAKRLSIKKVARDLALKKEIIEAIEGEEWDKLPEPPFTKGFIKNYAQYLGLDAENILAHWRRQFDEAQYPQKPSPIARKRRFLITPNRFLNFIFFIALAIFTIYLTVQYLSILSGPKLEVYSPEDDLTTTIPVIQVTGRTESEATISIDGEFAAVDAQGNFSYQVNLKDGQNVIEIIASKRLSPKTKSKKVVRLIR